MSGPKTHVNYIGDAGVTYNISFPTWQTAFVGDAAATSSTPKPVGLRPRYRMLRGNTTGREYRVHVGDPALTAWTADKGAAVVAPPTIPGAPDTAFHYGGRIGERDLIRS